MITSIALFPPRLPQNYILGNWYVLSLDDNAMNMLTYFLDGIGDYVEYTELFPRWSNTIILRRH